MLDASLGVVGWKIQLWQHLQCCYCFKARMWLFSPLSILHWRLNVQTHSNGWGKNWDGMHKKLPKMGEQSPSRLSSNWEALKLIANLLETGKCRRPAAKLPFPAPIFLLRIREIGMINWLCSVRVRMVFLLAEAPFGLGKCSLDFRNCPFGFIEFVWLSIKSITVLKLARRSIQIGICWKIHRRR